MGKQTRLSSRVKLALKNFSSQQLNCFLLLTGTWSRSWSINWPSVIRRAVKRDDGLGAFSTNVFETTLADGKSLLGKDDPNVLYMMSLLDYFHLSKQKYTTNLKIIQ